METDMLLTNLERINHIADILLDLLASETQIQTLVKIIVETSTMPEA